MYNEFSLMKMKFAQSCSTLCDCMDYTIHGLLQARILKCQPFPSPGALPNPGIKPRSPTLQMDSLPAELPGKPFQRPKYLFCLPCLYFLEFELGTYVCANHSVLSNSLQPQGLQPSRFLCPRNSPGRNTGVGCHSLPQGIFPTQGLNLGLLHCRYILYHLSYSNEDTVTHIVD